MLPELIAAIILGIVQGIAEFAPISSSAHLIIVPWLFGWDYPAISGLAFDVSLHIGTLAAVVIYFWSDLTTLFKAAWRSIVEWNLSDDPARKLAWLLVIATIPAIIVGYFLEDVVDATFHASGSDISTRIMLMIAFMLAFFGLIMYLVERYARHDRPLDSIRFIDALAIGLAQTLALFPGVSRSGSTITAGMALGFRRDVAARFSFLLSIPVTFGACVKGLLDISDAVRTGSLVPSDLIFFAVGILSAGIAGYLVIRFLLRYLRTQSIMVFVIYRWALAAVVVVVALWRA
jgi:undecaprenyl-diphosphatase